MMAFVKPVKGQWVCLLRPWTRHLTRFFYLWVIRQVETDGSMTQRLKALTPG